MRSKRRQINDALIAQHREALIHDLQHGSETVAQISQRTGISQNRIYALCDEIKLDMDARRSRLKKEIAENERLKRQAQILAEIKANPRLLELNLQSMVKHFRCTAYTIHDALREIGAQPGTRNTIERRTETLDSNMAGALSRQWLARAWRPSQGATR